MVSDDKIINMLLKKFPIFKNSLDEYIDLFGKDSGLSGYMAAFSHYIIEKIEKNNISSDELRQVFIFMERILLTESDSVKDAVATCFLENLINAVAWGRISSLSFVHLLGSDSNINSRENE